MLELFTVKDESSKVSYLIVASAARGLIKFYIPSSHAQESLRDQ